MRNTMMIAAALCAAAVTQVSAMNLSWGVEIIDNPDDWTALPGLVQMYLADGTFINQAAGTEPLGTTATFYQTPGPIGSGTYNWNGGQSFYFVVYNAETIGDATRMITTANFVMPTFADQNDNTALAALNNNIGVALHNNNGYIALDDSRWEAVPEPASMALFGIGAGVLALRRRFGKKAA